MSTTSSPEDIQLTPLRQWVLNQQARSLPALMFLQRNRNEMFTSIMKVASFTGTEDFYAALLMFAVWIVNAKLGWTIGYVLCIGFCFTNVVKDRLRLPRPPPPVVPLERAFDWGFPSHHALMVTFLSLCMGDCLLKQGLLATNNFYNWLLFSAAWVSTVGFSRLYIGVHSIADLIAGAITGLSLALIWVNYEQQVDRYITSDQFRWWHFALFAVILFVFYPIAKPATTTFLDCMVTIGAATGCAIAQNHLRTTPYPSLFALPASSFSNSLSPYFCATARLILGFSLEMMLRQVCKKVVPMVLRPILSNVWGRENVMQNVQRFIESQQSFTHAIPPPPTFTHLHVAVPSWVSNSNGHIVTPLFSAAVPSKADHNGHAATKDQTTHEKTALSQEEQNLLIYFPRIRYLHDAVLRFVVYLVIAWAAFVLLPPLFNILGI